MTAYLTPLFLTEMMTFLYTILSSVPVKQLRYPYLQYMYYKDNVMYFFSSDIRMISGKVDLVILLDRLGHTTVTIKALPPLLVQTLDVVWEWSLFYQLYDLSRNPYSLQHRAYRVEEFSVLLHS